jgi:tRNA A37 threonylcarbamoyltransferase TsaD
VVVASNRFNTDNAAMIGAAGLFRFARGERSGADLEPDAALPFPGLMVTPAPSGIAR